MKVSPGCSSARNTRLVRLAAGVRLHVGEAAAEQLAGALDRELLGDVDELAAAIVALARIALGVFVGHHRALRLEHGAARRCSRRRSARSRRAGGRARARSRGRSRDRLGEGRRKRRSSRDGRGPASRSWLNLMARAGLRRAADLAREAGGIAERSLSRSPRTAKAGATGIDGAAMSSDRGPCGPRKYRARVGLSPLAGRGFGLRPNERSEAA